MLQMAAPKTLLCPMDYPRLKLSSSLNFAGGLRFEFLVNSFFGKEIFVLIFLENVYAIETKGCSRAKVGSLLRTSFISTILHCTMYFHVEISPNYSGSLDGYDRLRTQAGFTAAQTTDYSMEKILLTA